jgi:enoyl-[acyl-carrier protein] reductase II
MPWRVSSSIPRLSVIPVRALKNAGTEAFTAKQREIAAAVDRGELDLAAGQLAIEHYWAGALRRAVVDGDIETGSLMAGQSVGMVTREQPVAEIIDELVTEANAALNSRAPPSFESAA